MILSATAVLTAVWLGILTSISPCPLATNVAAMSFIGKELSSPRRVLLTGVLYTLGWRPANTGRGDRRRGRDFRAGAHRFGTQEDPWNKEFHGGALLGRFRRWT